MILRMIALNLIQCYNAILEMQVRNINICTRSRTRKVIDGNRKLIYLFNFFLLHFFILFLQVVQSKYCGKKKHIKQMKPSASSQMSQPQTLLAFRGRGCFYVFRKVWGFLFLDLTTSSVDYYKELASLVYCGKDFQGLTATVWRTKPLYLFTAFPFSVYWKRQWAVNIWPLHAAYKGLHLSTIWAAFSRA